jgi:hypothetical protein
MQVRLSNHMSPGPTNESKSQTVYASRDVFCHSWTTMPALGQSLMNSGLTSRQIRCRGCCRIRIRVRLSYYRNQDFNERSGRSSRSDSPQTWPPDGRPTRRKGGGWTHCVDATKHARTESKYCRGPHYRPSGSECGSRRSTHEQQTGL